MPKTKAKKNQNQIVKATRLNTELKEKLDDIDENTKKEFINGYYESRLRIEMAMWKKGKAIEKYVKYRGVKFTLSYYKLEKETGRSRPSLKKWHELYTKHSDMNAYKKIAEKKADDWTHNAYWKFLSKSELTDNETKQLPKDTEEDEYSEYYDEVFRRLNFERLNEKRAEKFYKAHNLICDDSIKLYDAIIECCEKFKCIVCRGELEELRLYLNSINRDEKKRARESINQSQTKKKDKKNKCPSGGVFGEDTDNFKECDDCQKRDVCNEIYNLNDKFW